MNATDSGKPPQEQRKRREIGVFLFLTVLMWPILAMVIVAGYGFLIWISQMIMGPPTS